MMPLSLLLRMRNVSDKVVEKIETLFMFKYVFFFENRAFYEIMRKNIVEHERPQTTISYGPRALHAEYLTLQIHIQNM